MLLYRRDAQIFQKSRSHPKILDVRTVTNTTGVQCWAHTIIRRHRTKFSCHGDLALGICAILLYRTRGHSASTSHIQCRTGISGITTSMWEIKKIQQGRNGILELNGNNPIQIRESYILIITTQYKRNGISSRNSTTSMSNTHRRRRACGDEILGLISSRSSRYY
jgi:hypothetical protein